MSFAVHSARSIVTDRSAMYEELLLPVYVVLGTPSSCTYFKSTTSKYDLSTHTLKYIS